jgi:hypothetical protein
VTVDFQSPPRRPKRYTFDVEIIEVRDTGQIKWNPSSQSKRFCAGVDRAITIVVRALNFWSAYLCTS